VGVIGFFAPHTLGVGYDNITGILSGRWPLTLICTLCLCKFMSWAIALGSGTSGGTLAPLLTIGGAAGAIIGIITLMLFPNSGVSIPMAALIGMSAMFAGASRAYLTSITFALEATMQSHALLPLLGACTAAYMVSFFLMENTIMTEKIARRGIFTPDSFEPDVLQKMHVSQVISDEGTVINVNNSIADVRSWVNANSITDNYFIMVNNDGEFNGTLKLTDIYSSELDPEASLQEMLKKEISLSVNSTDTLRYAMEIMSKTEVEVLPVLSPTDHKVIGILSYRDIISAFKIDADKTQHPYVKISLKRQRMKMLVRGRKTVNVNTDNK
ncbi:MAG TPA: chloride channel protein, partial [Mucilaginibacter sp.]|nr:chloride channel protein [Mucilaginibacter sp.]